VPTFAFILLSVFGGPAFQQKAPPSPVSPPARMEKAPQRTEAPKSSVPDAISAPAPGGPMDLKRGPRK